jgi:hypothetical protein
MVLHDELQAKGAKSVTAVQFHDRLVQCLTHVCASLACLTEFVSSGAETKSQAEWNALNERIRGILRMEPGANDAASKPRADTSSKVELF